MTIRPGSRELRAILADVDANLVDASRGADALRRFEVEPFAAIVLNLDMTADDGLAVAQRIRGQQPPPRTPIIFLAPYNLERAQLERVYGLGAVDLLVKPIYPFVLKVKVGELVDRFQSLAERREAEDNVRRWLHEEASRRATQEGEEKFRGFMEQAPFGIQVLSCDGRPVWVNRAWEELWGVTLDEIGHYNVFDDPQLQAKGLLSYLHRALAGEVIVIPDIEYDPKETNPTRHQDPVRWVSAMAYPLKDNDGHVREVVLVYEDISARRRAEAVLRESEEKLLLVADTIPQLAWMSRPDGYIFWYNRRWYDYTGTTPEQMQGWGWQSVHDPEALPEVMRRWKVSLATAEPFDMVFPLKGADGQFRTFLTRTNPLRDSQGRVLYWFGTNTDISEIKRMEEALRRRRPAERRVPGHAGPRTAQSLGADQQFAADLEDRPGSIPDRAGNP